MIVSFSSFSNSSYKILSLLDFSQTSKTLRYNLFGLVVAFLLTFRIVYNIPDRAVVLLLWFFKYMLTAVGRTFHISGLQTTENFPQSIQGCYSLLDLQKSPYKEYIVCPSCHLLFDIDTLLAASRRLETSKCLSVEFPNHPQANFRLPCNTILVYTEKEGTSV